MGQLRFRFLLVLMNREIVLTAAMIFAVLASALILAGTGAMLAAAVVLALASAPHRGAAAKQGTFPLLVVVCTLAALLG